MTNGEQKKLIQKESKHLWKSRGFRWLFLGVVILLAIVIFNSITYHARLIVCKIHLYCLSPALDVYMNDFDGKLPPADAWNDLLIEFADVNESMFHCPGSKSSGKTSDYAINAHLYESKLWVRESPLLFECKPGWNQVGGVEIFNSENHKNNGGCYNTSGIPEGQFIIFEEVESLKWKP